MHDLRKQALLESGKTVSRKARSRIASATGSKANSPAPSRGNSRTPSRVNSDDEDAMSDDTAWSTNSIDDILHGEDVPPDAWINELNTRIEQIVNLKRSTTDGRAESLRTFAHILTHRYAREEVEGRVSELLPSILRSIRQETTELEALTALKALNALVVTLDSGDIYDSVADEVRRKITNSESIAVKTSAIHALGLAAFLGGASEGEMEDIMTFYFEIVESDGLSADAHDEASVVRASLEEWGLLATEMEDLEDITETVIEAFVDQLQSSDPGVQVAAGENIALLYEKSYTPREDDEDISEDNDAVLKDEYASPGSVQLVRRYTVYHRKDQLLHTLDELASLSTHRVSKKDRKTLHSSFADIRNSVEVPSRGPKYSMALDKETGLPYGGGRMKISINRTVQVVIDRWWKLQRLNALNRVLEGGFAHHYDENEAVSRCLPFSLAASRSAWK